MMKSILTVLVMSLFLCHSSPASEIIIEGTDSFKEQIRKALALIARKAPYEFSMVKTYVGKIKQGEKSGMWAYLKPPTYVMSDKTAFYSLTWCAGTIVHDAYHSKLYHDYKKHHSKVPDEIWTGQKAELECNEWQLKVMNQIGAPRFEIDHLKTMDGLHFDLNKNGRYDEEDYRKRDW